MRKDIAKAQKELELEALALEEQAEMLRLFAVQLDNVRSYGEMVALERKTGAFDTRHYPPATRQLFSILEETHN